MVCKKCSIAFVTLVALVVSLALIVTQAQPTATGENGRIHVSFNNVHSPGLDTSGFETLIFEAIALLEETHVSTDGTDVHTTEFWVSQESYDAFQNEIDVAQNLLDYFSNLDVIGTFAPGDSFEMSLRIEGNTGFASMGVRVYVPEGLELTHISVPGFQGMTGIYLPGYDPDTGAITPIVGSNFAYVAFFDIEDFKELESDLLIYTFRVSENADIWKTNPITIAFAGVRGYLPPTNADGVARDILLPNNDSGVLGSIIIASE
ncbi:MAG: hypothetical protein FWE27_02670 [Defluviitaleaceae bacterium]|nr:hypothetical protein [Defluviitaleaceae bacterium]